VRFRRNERDLPFGAYLIMLQEVPLVMGTIEAERPAETSAASDAEAPSPTDSVRWKRYCPRDPGVVRAAGIADAALTTAVHPQTGAPGCWIAPDSWAQAEAAGLELWAEPTTYLIVHLEAVLRRNLAEFIGVDAVGEWLARPATRPELVKEAVPDIPARLALLRVLRALAEEEVPINAEEAILEAFLETQRGQDTLATVHAVRRRLRDRLPGNHPDTEHLVLPSQLEARVAAGVSGEGDRRRLALAPEETQEVLAEIRTLVQGDKGQRALVVRDAELRPFVRRLVQLEWPSLHVLARGEILSLDRGSLAGHERAQEVSHG
jgi:flagellar biosynthesis component FlhA